MILSIYTYLFQRGNRYYLFNSESLFFSEISKELYAALKGYGWQKLPEDVVEELRVKKVIVPKEEKYTFYYDSLTRFLNDAYGSDVMSLIIAPTTHCNFNCQYCFEPKKHPKYISGDVEDAIISYLNNQIHIKNLSLTWYGGEPLLMTDSIRRLHDRILKETDKKIAYHEVITNGYLIDDKVISIFRDMKLNSIQITLDGTRDTHNRTRM